MPLWEQVKGNLVEWYSTAAEKTEELAKIGVRRYDKFGISRDIERQFTELGGFVYNALQEGREDFLGEDTVQAIVRRIKGLEEDLRRKEEEIAVIRRTHQRKAAAKAAAAGSEASDASGSERGDASGMMGSDAAGSAQEAGAQEVEVEAEEGPAENDPGN